jgi:PAS domain S-box-containing protein
MTATAIRSPGGASPFFILTLQDITERKRAEEAVVDSRNFFRSLINELPNPIRISDTDSKCDYVNKTWTDFTNRQFDQEIGERWTEGIHPEDRERVGEICGVSFRNRTPYVTEYRLKHASGKYRWVVEFGRPFNNIDGSFAGYIVPVTMSKRKMFERLTHLLHATGRPAEPAGVLHLRSSRSGRQTGRTRAFSSSMPTSTVSRRSTTPSATRKAISPS